MIVGSKRGRGRLEYGSGNQRRALRGRKSRKGGRGERERTAVINRGRGRRKPSRERQWEIPTD